MKIKQELIEEEIVKKIYTISREETMSEEEAKRRYPKEYKEFKQFENYDFCNLEFSKFID